MFAEFSFGGTIQRYANADNKQFWQIVINFWTVSVQLLKSKVY